jgi:hypothetical protein
VSDDIDPTNNNSHHLDSFPISSQDLNDLNEKIDEKQLESEIFSYVDALFNGTLHNVNDEYCFSDRSVKVDISEERKSSTASNLSPLTLLIPDTIQGHTHRFPLVCLIDSGSSVNHLRAKCLPKGVTPTVTKSNVLTLHGVKEASRKVTMSDIVLPEFSINKKIPGPEEFLLFDNDDCPYDVIIGRAMLKRIGMSPMTATDEIVWLEDRVAFKPRDFYGNTAVDKHKAFAHYVRKAFDVDIEDSMDTFVTRILDSSYEAVSINEVVDKQQHLTDGQKQDLTKLLSKFTKLFSGKLGCYPFWKIHLDLLDGAKPVHK